MKRLGAALLGLILTGCTAAAPVGVEGNAASGLIQPANIKVNFTANSITTEFANGDAGVAGRPVTINDPVRVASISKLVVAIAVMRMVERGSIDLDKDVGDYLGWQVRNPAFPDTPVTMRQLLSHRSGLRDKIDYIVPLDRELPAVLANPEAWEAKHAPGAYFSYANINSPLIAAVIEGATGDRFDRAMHSWVLAPLKLDACYNWGAGCSDGRRAEAVTLLRPSGALALDAPISGKDPCPVYPATDGSCDVDSLYKLARNGSAFSPQGGLRISAHDLAKIGQVLLNEGRPLLARKTFAEMIGPVWTFNGKNGDDDKGYFKAYGLGIHWFDDGKGGRWFGHVGEAYSLRAGFWVNQQQGRGFVRYTTMVDEFAGVGHCFDRCP